MEFRIDMWALQQGKYFTKTCLVWWGFEFIGENQQGRWESARLEGIVQAVVGQLRKGGDHHRHTKCEQSAMLPSSTVAVVCVGTEIIWVHARALTLSW